MGIFRKIFSRKDHPEKEPPSIQTLVANEICTLILNVFASLGIVTNGEVYLDNMEWFRIRERRSGEDGSHYGVPEIISQPDKIAPMWPPWLKLIPTSQLADVRLEAHRLARDRSPLGGHLMHEENLRKAVCEFAGHLIYSLCEVEEQARLSTQS